MKNEKLCEYLSELGVLLFDNIDLFLQINSTNNSKQFNSEQEKLKNSLFLYLEKTTKNENLLNKMSNNLIESFYNNQAINRYKELQNLFVILKSKLYSHYNNFISRVSQYIINNTNNIICFEPINENRNKLKLRKNNSDDMVLRNEKDMENENKQIEKKSEVKLKPKKKKECYKYKKVNKYKNNWYRDINDNRVIQHGFFVDDYDNLQKFNNINGNYKFRSSLQNNPYTFGYNNININNNHNNRYEDEDYILNTDNNPYMINNFKSSELPLKHYTPMYNKYNDENQNIDYLVNDYDYIQNTDAYSSKKIDNYDFFESQEKHEQKVQKKLMILGSQKELNFKKECPFIPKINSNWPNGVIPKHIVDQKFEKLYKDYKKREEIMKNNPNELKFKPNLKETENYLVLTTFQQRLEKSINNKKNRKKNDNNMKENKLKKGINIKINNKNEENKKSIIKSYKIDNSYSNNIEKKKNNLDNIIIKEISDMKKSKNDDNNKEDEKEKEKNVDKNEIILNNKNEEEEKNNNNENQKDINEGYQSSLKNILNNNSLLKKDY